MPISDSEMGSNAVASYNPSKNVLYVRNSAALYSVKEAPLEIEQFAFGKDDRSNYVHELFHWKDAETFRKKHGEITSGYLQINNEECKKKIDKLVGKGYNISEISLYSKEAIRLGKFYEVYTEYRTKKLLSEVK